MRLIDADALVEYKVTGEIDNLSGDFVPGFAIAMAPTIDAEPVRYGKWQHLGGDEWCCTVCGEVIYTEGSWEKPTHKYCHECGAKMEEIN